MRAHVPALRALPGDFEIVGVANSNKASSQRAANAVGIPKAFANVSELLGSPDVDIVTIAVRVPYHLELARAAIDAGKHLYCEWPLGNGLGEAEEMASRAHARGVLAVVGTQAPFAPEIERARQLVATGFAGEILSTTLVARGGPVIGGGTIPDKKNYGYMLDPANGATMLTIPVGHTLAAVRSVLGEVAEVSASLATRRPSARALDSGELLAVSAPDEVLLIGTLESGIPLSLHYRGGGARDGDGLLWEIHGTDGDIRIRGSSGHSQMVQLSLTGARGEKSNFDSISLDDPTSALLPSEAEPRNVARLYAAMARDLRDGTRTVPTFDDGVAVHRIIAAIESSAKSGLRTAVGA
jgi:predicted dehydrogenase